MAGCLPSSQQSSAWWRNEQLNCFQLCVLFAEALRVGGMPCRSAARQLALELAKPLQLGPKLFNHEGDHPHCFMVRVADFI